MTIELDATDRRLLSLLQKDGKASVGDLAAELGMSTSPCWRRIRRLEEAGVITGYSARLDPKKLGLNALAYVFVTLIDHREATLTGFLRMVEAETRIVECSSIPGACDFLLMVAARDPEDLEGWLMKGVLATDLVRESHTHFVLRRNKTRSPWPILL